MLIILLRRGKLFGLVFHKAVLAHRPAVSSYSHSSVCCYLSEFSRKASVADQLQRQEQLIRKLTSDLKLEKEESKKKDAALRKYESFYREVKARSAQKAAQRQMENTQRQHKSRNSNRK